MKRKAIKYPILILAFFSLYLSLDAQHNAKTYLFIGTYTEGKPAKGIYVYEFNLHSGKCRFVSAVDIIQLNDYPHWHKATDTIDKISSQSMKIVGDTVLASLPIIAAHERQTPRRSSAQ